MPAPPKNETASSVAPAWETVSMRTVWPDFTRSTGVRVLLISPRITVCGVEPSGVTVWAAARPGRARAAARATSFSLDGIRASPEV